MDKVKINFENCYGIRHLEHEFEFTNNNMPVVIYSPNGTMKTSFAMTFQDQAKDLVTKDRIYADRETVRSIADENGQEISSDSILVVKSYDEEYKSSNISKLMVSRELKKEYDEIYESINEKKKNLLKSVAKASGIKKQDDIERDFAKVFNLTPKQIFTVFGRVEREVKKGGNPDFANIPYKKIFSDNIVSFLEKGNFKSEIAEYSRIYEELIDKSNYYKRGVFNHNNAATIAKNLKTNGWFDSGHSVNLKAANNSLEITDLKGLEDVIQAEKEAILGDKDLLASFDKIDKALSNAELKSFREYILENQFIIPELTNPSALKEKLWIAYLNSSLLLFEELMEEYDVGAKRITEIIAEAKEEATKWKEVIKIFNERFSVPFIVNMDNQDDVILGIESPQISFDFKDFNEGDAIKVNEATLKEVLSNGERRALYILNIIFEVIARQEAEQETIIVVDDIADSFDYKNKYAIIEYLKDIREVDFFHLIILTHNFDFYRTVKSRLQIYTPNKLHSIRTNGGISLISDPYNENPFIQWRDQLSESRMMIASIPFVRNLAEYIGYNEEFTKLTTLLHIKTTTHLVTFANLEQIFKMILHDSVEFAVASPDDLVLTKIYDECDVICGEADETIELESKIILSMGIRLKTEEYLINKINDSAWSDNISKNQTSKLIKRFKRDFSGELEIIDFIERVNLMTPENIHLNSFMYEPILDMSNQHLKQLYLKAQNILI